MFALLGAQPRNQGFINITGWVVCTRWLFVILSVGWALLFGALAFGGVQLVSRAAVAWPVAGGVTVIVGYTLLEEISDL